MNEYSIEGIMSTDVLSVRPDLPVIELSALMSQQKYSCLPVVDAGKPVGIITERDIVRYLAKTMGDVSSIKETLASDLMSRNLILMHQEQSLLDALVVSQANKVRHLPVVDHQGFLKGIVTYTDIINVQRSILESQTAIIERSIKHRTAELIEANRILQEMSLVDPLMGVGNRRAMEVDVECTHDLSKRYEDCYAIAMIDVDKFKLYNDHYGHQAGDEALKQVANSIKDTVRSTDRIYRYGGEEILILLPKTDFVGASQLAGRILKNLESEQIPHVKSGLGILTASCGLAVYDDKKVEVDTQWTDVIRTADVGLYSAKSSGRNCVESQELCA